MSGYPSIELYIDGRWKRADGQPELNPADETCSARSELKIRREISYGLRAVVDRRSANFLKA